MPRKLAEWAVRFNTVPHIVNKTIHVTILADELAGLVNAFIAQAQVVYRNSAFIMTLDGEKLVRYFKTLIWLRVKQVENASHGEAKSYNTRHYRVPAYVAVLLLNIGVAHDRTNFFKLVPKMDKPQDAMTHDEMMEMTELIVTCRDAFFPVKFTRPSEIEGSVEFMSKVIVKNLASTTVQSYRAGDSQVYAYLAALVGSIVDEAIITNYMRVEYGERDLYLISHAINLVDEDEVPPGIRDSGGGGRGPDIVEQATAEV